MSINKNNAFYKMLVSKINQHDTCINSKPCKQFKTYLTKENIKKITDMATYHGISKSLLINDIIELL